MNILLIEDNPVHIEAAKQDLVDHNLTIYTSWKNLLSFYYVPAVLTSDYIYKPEEHKKALLEYDMILTDINFPGMLDMDGSEPLAPLGLIMVIRAAEAGVKYIAAISDKNHHADAIAKGLDLWMAYNKPFQIGSSTIAILGDGKFMKGHYQDRVKDWAGVLKFLLGE